MLQKDNEKGEVASGDIFRGSSKDGASSANYRAAITRSSLIAPNAGRRDPRFGYESIGDNTNGMTIIGLASGIETSAISEVSSDSTRRRANSPHMSSSSKCSDSQASVARADDDDSTFRKIRAFRMSLDDVMISVFERLGFQRVGNCFVKYRRHAIHGERNVQINTGINPKASITSPSALFTAAQTDQNTGDDWVVGPHYPGVIFTLFLTFFITALLFRLVHKSESLNQRWNNIALTVISLATITTFINVVLKDPGIVQISPLGFSSKLATMPYCDMCEIYQAPRTAHCPHCDVCIAGLDHHCPWIGKCIGKGNMHQFAWFNCCWIFYFFYFIFLIAKS